MNNDRTAEPRDALSVPYVVIDDFLPADIARRMRADIDAHFSEPSKHRPESHQIWNYWFVPGTYTYLRTKPEKVIQRDLVDQFLNVLRNWSVQTLGLGKVTWPYLSLYVPGCHQKLHNDSGNGRFAFVYSLTHIERRTVGGETILLREGDPFRRNLQTPSAGRGIHELIAPRFNRLVAFDDRLIHGVERVDGSMDPIDGRCVLHGHIEESGPITTGTLPVETLREGIRAAMDRFVVRWSATIQLYHGPLVVRFRVLREGSVADARAILDRVVRRELEDDDQWRLLKASLLEAVREGCFPATTGETIITLPITFGGQIRSA